MKPINRAIQVCGTQQALAQALGVSQGSVSQWITGRRPIPPHQCRKIEAATGGKVTCLELRPDVFAPLLTDKSA